MNKKIYLHIGPGKTGTSAIQAWLKHNNTWLEQQGILYPDHALDSNEISSGNLYSIMDRDDNGIIRLNHNKAKDLINTFLKNEKYHTLLLSSEWFFANIQPILNSQWFKHAHVIAYLRNPMELIESNYNQSVKRHDVFTPLIAKYEGFPGINVMRNLLVNYKRNKIILRPYHKELFENGNIISDLLISIGIENPPKIENKSINSSYSFEALEFKRLVNFFPIQKIQSDLDRTLQKHKGIIKNYTLIPKEFEEETKLKIKNQLNSFIKENNQNQLEPLIEKITFGDKKQYVAQQKSSTEQIRQVAEFIQNDNPSLYKKLTKIIGEHRYFYVDTDSFWEWFDSIPATQTINQPKWKLLFRTLINKKIKPILPSVSVSSGYQSDIEDSLQGFKQRLNLPNKMANERVLLSIAILCAEQGEYQFAESLYLQVLSMSPRNTRALIDINVVRQKRLTLVKNT